MKRNCTRRAGGQGQTRADDAGCLGGAGLTRQDGVNRPEGASGLDNIWPKSANGLFRDCCRDRATTLFPPCSICSRILQEKTVRHVHKYIR